MFYATSAGVEAAAPISLYSTGYTVSATCMTLTLLVVSFLRVDRTALLTDIRTKIVTGIALPLGTMLLIVNGQADNIALTIAGGIITGVFSGIMSLQWIVAYQRVGLRVAAGSFPMLMAMSVGICATLMYLPRPVITAAIIIFPLISEFMFHEVRKQPWPRFEEEAAYVRDKPINFVLMLLPFAVFAIATGYLDFSSDNGNYTFAFYAFGALIPLIASGVYLLLSERNRFISAFLVPLSFLVAVCVPFLTLSSLQPYSPFISIGELGIEVLLFIVPIGFAEFFSIDSLKTYALGRMVYVLFSGMGWYAAQFASQAYGQFMHSQMSLVIIFIGVEVLAVCLIVAIVKTQKSYAVNNDTDDHDTAETAETAITESEAEALRGNLGLDATSDSNFASGVAADMHEGAASRTISSGEARATMNSGAQPLKPASPGSAAISAAKPTGMNEAELMTKIAQEHGLSQREQDVFALLARGYTSARIQKELYIAAGTVNYHSRNIYAKLGVHSKQELIALCEYERANARPE